MENTGTTALVKMTYKNMNEWKAKTERPARPDSYLVRWIPDGHRTHRVAVLGRDIEQAMTFANEQKARGSKSIAVLRMDGFTGDLTSEAI